MTATIAYLDFENVDYAPYREKQRDKYGFEKTRRGRPLSSTEKKQIRRRIRRSGPTKQNLEALYGKPYEDWDLEELARGRPRDKNGKFTGISPKYVDRAIHEEILGRFGEAVRGEMNFHTASALRVIDNILNNNEEDFNGRPLVPVGTKLDAAKFLIEHVVGKPKQRVETDISVKLQAVLGAAMVSPSLDRGREGAYELTQGYIEAEAWEDDDVA